MSREEISDRHLREVAGLAPARASATVRVAIHAQSAARTAAGQHISICVVNLLGRRTDLVSSINLDLPKTSTKTILPNGARGGDLAGALSELVSWGVGEEVSVEMVQGGGVADLHLCIGDDVEAPAASTVLYALADGWRCWVGTASFLPQGAVAFRSTNPLGPFFAATLLAGEVFKRSRGTTRGRWIEDAGYSLWTGESGSWNDLRDGPEIAGLDLPALYIIGAGAVGQGLINLIGSGGFQSAYAVTIDDDAHDKTNFNRCFVAGIGDKDVAKVDAVKRYRGFTGLGGFEFRGTLADYLRSPRPGLREDLALREARDEYECVVSCVDKGSSRQDVQGLWPRILIGGSTLGLGAKAILYDLANGTPCLGCHNPPEKDGENLRKLEQQLRAMDSDQQRAFLAELPEVDEVLAYLAGSEGCGSVGEAALLGLATRGAREFSVSFVSMAASVLTAARLFARLLFEDAPERSLPPMTSFAFLNGSIDHGGTSVDHQCRRCGGDPRSSFSRNSPYTA